METYITKNKRLCVLLMCNGFVLVKSEKTRNGILLYLEHDNDALLRELIDQFLNTEAKVDMEKMKINKAIVEDELEQYGVSY